MVLLGYLCKNVVTDNNTSQVLALSYKSSLLGITVLSAARSAYRDSAETFKCDFLLKCAFIHLKIVYFIPNRLIISKNLAFQHVYLLLLICIIFYAYANDAFA